MLQIAFAKVNNEIYNMMVKLKKIYVISCVIERFEVFIYSKIVFKGEFVKITLHN